MADKPTIYGYCKAGCEWETVHKSDFDAAVQSHEEIKQTVGAVETQSNTNKEDIEKITNGSTTVKKAENATNAGKAEKVGESTVGSPNNPVYINNGVPKALSYTIEKSVPADAVFTDTTYGVATEARDGLLAAADKKKLDGLSDTSYTHPTTAGHKHIPAGGSSGQILRWAADGAAAWGAEKEYSAASQSAAGLMSATDKKKLDGIATGANKVTFSYSSGTLTITT